MTSTEEIKMELDAIANLAILAKQEVDNGQFKEAFHEVEKLAKKIYPCSIALVGMATKSCRQ